MPSKSCWRRHNDRFGIPVGLLRRSGRPPDRVAQNGTGDSVTTLRAGDTSAAGDLGRRVLARREELNLTIEQVAKRADMAPGYVEYLEHDPTVNPSIEALAKLARALEVSMGELSGGDQGRAQGSGGAAGDPVLTELDRGECEDLMRAGGIGRVVFRASGRPVAMPVNFKMLGTAVVFRSTEHGSIGAIDPKELGELRGRPDRRCDEPGLEHPRIGHGPSRQ